MACSSLHTTPDSPVQAAWPASHRDLATCWSHPTALSYQVGRTCVTMATFHHMPLLRSLGLAGEKRDIPCQLHVRLKFWPAMEGVLLGVSLQLVCPASAARSAALRLIAHTANRISSPINYSLYLFRSMNTLMTRPSVFLSWFLVSSPSSHTARSTNARKESSHGLSLLFPQASVLVGSLCQP